MIKGHIRTIAQIILLITLFPLWVYLSMKSMNEVFNNVDNQYK